MEGQENILLVDAGHGNEGVDGFDALFLQKLLIRAVSVDDDAVVEEHGQFLAPLGVPLNQGDPDAVSNQFVREIVGRLGAADNQAVLNGVKVEA